MTSWIEENILNDKGYVGRISLTINLKEMPLYQANQFWRDHDLVSAYEKFKILCVTGGIPRYLEEIQPKQSAEENIKRICYSPDGFLFTEFDKIFKDIFEKQAQDYKEIVRVLIDGRLEVTEIGKRLGVASTGGFSKKLKALSAAGFICRDTIFDIKGKETGFTYYRLCDNYLRFYLKYIEPKADLIAKGIYQDAAIDNLDNWYSIMGLQFQNLVLNNLAPRLKILKIPGESVISASPYLQKKTKRQEACQIDLMIQTRYSLYICEIKFRKKIEKNIIDEMLTKIKKLSYPSYLSVRPILIYQGDLAQSVSRSEFFSSIIQFDRLLIAPKD